ncbi:peptidoglycan bridge formation glycyltransferase FemA/FemB family protein [Algibacter sp. PT7-4]|uniref:peptidoglycan bridge formation glycyltransferase FemA/FemB family protein n=1 Tax=Algibacter ulvanivorans TaxID=3400999 RepID=UPI003AAD26AC
MIELIAEKDKWDSFISEFQYYDTYHTFDYHIISKSKEDTPILIKYTENNVVIGIPLLLRAIKNTPYKDAISVYGYSGPLSKGITENFNNTVFTKTLFNYFKKNNIISVFSRLNPYIKNQKKILENIGETCLLGKVVNINLNLNKEVQRQNYQSRLKNQINKARKNCSIKTATTNQDINEFIKIYNENMLRVKAKKTYFFDNNYFYNLVKSKSFKTIILLAIDNETKEIISGAMFLIKKSIVQYHLSGTKNDFLHLMPTKLLIDEMRVIANREKYTFFNLGGGLGGSNEDSLFKFKSTFSKDSYLFFIWKLIVNKKAYDEVCQKNEIKNLSSNFFPLYRLNESFH